MVKRFDAGEVITALVTPFNKDRKVDYSKIEELVKHVISTGSDSVLVAATTGESPTLTNEEEIEILSTAKRACQNKAKVIFSAGSNSTETAVKMTKLGTKEGADAILSVIPYYNKPSQEGMIEHFSAVAESTELPVIIYNIPGRTGANMSVSTMKYLSEKYSNIAGVKQSYNDLDVISEIRINCPEDFIIYCGDDSLTLPMLSLGAQGVVSVASHLWGKEIKSMINNFKNGNYVVAKNMHMKLYPIFKNLFMTSNPVPIKAALAKKGLIQEYVRRPLVELSDEQKEILYKVMDDFEQN
ncbi:MAG: 4-hydroxy-tetrahydrodipicolinate synthase [bacterium]|nr:4-hydroxy-tetrahydrodipicolinate synthase [bacterium]